MKKMLKLGLSAAIAGAAFAGLVAVPASAATELVGDDAPTIVDVSPGETASVPWAWKMGDQGYGFSGFKITFNAPEGTTFPSQGVPGVQAKKADGTVTSSTDFEFSGCSIGNAGLSMTCTQISNYGPPWPANLTYIITPKLQIANDAVGGVHTAAADVTLRARAIDADGGYSDGSVTSDASISEGTLNVNIDAPVADVAPVDITGATFQDNTATAVNGKGEPGSTITVTDPNGAVIGTDVVDESGNWSVPSNITENTTVTATDGVTEDSLDIVFADSPIIAAPIALGALALGGAGFGGVMLRRRQKAGANA